ncbi:putative ADP-ribosylation factor 6 [Blattamonas nauphoetae]|uniref:ADP-ribosylation factor 6 n=1 Tax=Blattamonas nauphoetae TaxID=2049346 RepID=A0ABQ9XLA4_9EUKA|nr:putative ADP-ribosylation factor 6 [Blattamonas nauphoetae]
MGNIVDKLSSIFGSKEYRIVLLGLDAAGKTTILYKLKVNEAIHTRPTIGFNMESVNIKNIKFDMWDVGGQKKLRHLWHHYYAGADAIIYVVDSADTERLACAANDCEDCARDELRRMLNYSELKCALRVHADPSFFSSIPVSFLVHLPLTHSLSLPPRDASLLVFANKQDMAGACSPAQIRDRLQLDLICRDRSWFVQPTCGITGDGLLNGLEWLGKDLKKKKKRR